MKRIHLAFGVADIEKSITDYSKRLGHKPQVHISGEYALWKNDQVNFSIRKTSELGFRHIGFEDSSVESFTEEEDINGMLWESFNEQAQIGEILSVWPEAEIKNKT